MIKTSGRRMLRGFTSSMYGTKYSPCSRYLKRKKSLTPQVAQHFASAKCTPLLLSPSPAIEASSLSRQHAYDILSSGFRDFISMLRVFHVDVAKVNRDVAYIAMAIHLCCKRLFQLFHLFFQMYVANVLIWMLYMFHMYFI
jgi:hypothetical protein